MFLAVMHKMYNEPNEPNPPSWMKFWYSLVYAEVYTCSPLKLFIPSICLIQIIFWIFQEICSKKILATFLRPIKQGSLAIWVVISVTRLADFYKFLATNCLTKVAQIFLWLFGLFQIMSLLYKKCIGYFLGNFRGKLGNFLFHQLVTLSVTNS